MLQDRLEQVQLCHVHLFHTITVCRDQGDLSGGIWGIETGRENPWLYTGQ